MANLFGTHEAPTVSPWAAIPQFVQTRPTEEYPDRREIVAEQRAEIARLKAIEAARAAEQAELDKQTEAKWNASLNVSYKPTAVVSYSPSFSNTYGYGYCTWYVASQRRVPNNWGNAKQWLSSAIAAGYSTGAEPRVGAIAVSQAGSWGHVALVAGVAPGLVTVSEMNFAGWNVVSSRTTSAAEFTYIY